MSDESVNSCSNAVVEQRNRTCVGKNKGGEKNKTEDPVYSSM